MIPGIIFVVSFFTHFIFMGRPGSVVFDEVFYGRFMSDYWHGLYFFDQHPPFFKLLMAGIGWLTGASNYMADWASIGNPVPDQIIILRIVPIIAGTLLPIVIYALLRRLNFSKTASCIAGLLLCFENSLIVQSRFILPDVVMLLFGFTALLCYIEYIRRLNTPRAYWFLLFSILCVTATFSIKWTGLAFLLVIFAMEIYRTRALTRKYMAFVGSYLGISFIIYIMLFAIHFSLLPHSGKGDVFMSRQFQKTLVGNENAQNTSLRTRGFFGKFVELNDVMFSANHRMTATHPYASKWYTWPFLLRTVFYWQSPAVAGQPSSYIYLLGNPFIYLLGTASILLLAFRTWRKKNLNPISFFILIGFFANLLPFALIGRVMFLYHYEAALIFSIIAIAYLFDRVKPQKRRVYAGIILGISLIAFVYWSPLTYGTPLSQKELKSRMWLGSWR